LLTQLILVNANRPDFRHAIQVSNQDPIPRDIVLQVWLAEQDDLLRSLAQYFSLVPNALAPEAGDLQSCDVLGLGPGAASRFGNSLGLNASDPAVYCSELDQGRLPIADPHNTVSWSLAHHSDKQCNVLRRRQRRQVLLHLRVRRGVHAERLRQAHVAGAAFPG
jgi:hypothetical protein